MQNKGAIRLFAILLALVCVFQLSFTLVTRSVEKKATEFSTSEKVMALAKEMGKGDAFKEKYFLDSISKSQEKYFFDSISSTPVYNLLIKNYTYKECKEKEICLGLDLKGGMNVTLEVSVVDIVKALSNNSVNVTFNKAIDKAVIMQRTSQDDFITLFDKAFTEIDPNARLASPDIFNTRELKDKGITAKSTNKEVIEVIRKEAEGAIDRTYNILTNRIDKFGVAQPNIQRLANTGRILVELPGIGDPDRARKILQTTAELQFWLTYENSEIFNSIDQLNQKLSTLLSGKKLSDSLGKDSLASINDTIAKKDTSNLAKADTSKNDLLNKLDKDTSKVNENADMAEYSKKNPLFALLRPALIEEKGQYYPAKGPVVGTASVKDTAKINSYLRLAPIKAALPRELKLSWTAKSIDKDGQYLQLIALKAINARDSKGAAMEGDKVIDAYQDYGQNGGVEIVMVMNGEGATMWKRLTGNQENIGKSVAIVLDNYVYSFPTVNEEIPNGRSSISGNFTVEEAQDLANVLKAGKLPAPARIVEEAIVGPSLGQESITAGFTSFIIALLVVLCFMVFYYSRAGWAANVALFANFFFIMGILASMGAVLTLPGIAGIVLTMGMAVDANIIIYERVREELSLGKGLRLAVTDGFKHSYNAIIDGNVTTLLVGIILYIFGSGSIKGFATTLVIGIFTTLFTAIFITRLILERRLDRNLPISFFTKLTEGAFKKINIDFMGNRKIMYIVSSVIIISGTVSLITRGYNYGIDFTGGRTYIVEFSKDVVTEDVKGALAVNLGSSPEVKTFGSNNKVKITTKYLVDNNSVTADSDAELKVYEGLKKFLGNDVTYELYKEKYLLSSQKVGPSVARDVLFAAYMSVFLALIAIFLYILVRFNKWQFALGAIASLAHDAFFVLSAFSLLNGVLPFALEVDQGFIAAVLTVIGYSINDTVIIFDRVREYSAEHKKWDIKQIVNGALNSTLSRTINTVATVIFTLLAIFIFGGDVIRGFTFAMLIGVIVGTYSSLFIASPIYYDTMLRSLKKAEKTDKK
ncbi:MAG: protein translocase subunit SecDF [Bacteroidota bacterium]